MTIPDKLNQFITTREHVSVMQRHWTGALSHFLVDWKIHDKCWFLHGGQAGLVLHLYEEDVDNIVGNLIILNPTKDASEQ